MTENTEVPRYLEEKKSDDLYARTGLGYIIAIDDGEVSVDSRFVIPQ